jgi:hypothetical protein
VNRYDKRFSYDYDARDEIYEDQRLADSGFNDRNDERSDGDGKPYVRSVGRTKERYDDSLDDRNEDRYRYDDPLDDRNNDRCDRKYDNRRASKFIDRYDRNYDTTYSPEREPFSPLHKTVDRSRYDEIRAKYSDRYRRPSRDSYSPEETLSRNDDSRKKSRQGPMPSESEEESDDGGITLCKYCGQVYTRKHRKKCTRWPKVIVIQPKLGK